jgi:predicted alpha/beta-hydrolase family hydrolase
MELVKTKSFELAVSAKGDRDASRLALLLPGRLDTKDYAHMQSHVDALSQKGCYALSFDPPGTWDSPGDISLYTTENYIKAVDELIEYFGNKPTVIMGHSRGGSVAIVAGMNNPYVTHFVAAMSHYRPSERPEVSGEFRTSYRDLPPGTEETKERKRFDLPMSYFDDSTKYTGLESSKKPKLFFLGKQDDIVLPEDVKEAYELSAEPKQLYELNSDHDYRYHPEVMGQVIKITRDFLEKTGFFE